MPTVQSLQEQKDWLELDKIDQAVCEGLFKLYKEYLLDFKTKLAIISAISILCALQRSLSLSKNEQHDAKEACSAAQKRLSAAERELKEAKDTAEANAATAGNRIQSLEVRLGSRLGFLLITPHKKQSLKNAYIL